MRYGLTIGAKCAPIVLGMMYLFGQSHDYSAIMGPDIGTAPIAWPMAKLLDWALGKNESHTYKKAELK